MPTKQQENRNMEFSYSDAPQHSPTWFELRRGKVTASRLEDYMARSKRDGSPLKACTDYMRELEFEREFDTSFEVWVSSAMEDGVLFENFGRQQYEKITGRPVVECGCWFNELFVASPDGTVGDDGLVEIKLLKDNSFTDVLSNGVPDRYFKQIQGQLFASNRKWCDFVAINLNTKKVVIIRVEPDKSFFTELEAALKEPIAVEPFSHANLYDLVGEIPDRSELEPEFNFNAEGANISW